MADADDDGALRVAIVGRPNVGKSTLFNQLIGEERSVVHDMPGTIVEIRGHVRLLAIGRHMLVENGAGVVLAAHGVLQRLCPRQGTDRLDDLGLLAAHGIGVEGVRRFHRRHGQQLEHMVGHHVAQRAGLFVEFAALFDADRLGGGDLDMVDMRRDSRSARTGRWRNAGP